MTARDTPTSLSVRSYVADYRATVMLIAGSIFAMFVSAAVVPYAFSDDYSILWMAVSGKPSAQFGKNILDASADGGRPFAGLLTQWFFTSAGTIDNLRFIRLFAILTIIALALLLHLTLIRSGIAAVPAALIAVFVSSMPAFQVYASWTVLFSVPLAALLAGAASLTTVAMIDGPPHLVVDRSVGAIVLLLAALLIYQPPAMFFWVFLAVALVGARSDSTRAFRVARAHFAVGAAALALAYLATKLAVHLSGRGGRTALAHDVVAKARWFIRDPLYHSLNLFDLTPSKWLAVLVVVTAAGGMLLWLLTRGHRPLLYVAVGLGLVPLTYLPNLVVADTWPPYRTQVSLSGLIALYVSIGALGGWLVLRDWLRPHLSRAALKRAERAALAAAIAVVGVSTIAAAKNVITLVVDPQMTELRLLRSQVAAVPANPPRIAFVETDWYGGVTNQVVYDEFGFPSSARPWVLEPSVDLVLREEGRLTPSGPSPEIDPYAPYATTFPHTEPLVDLRGLQRLR